jgi:uncharacterized membrane protein
MMSDTAKYVWAALIVAVATHFALIFAAPHFIMGKAIERIGAEGFNAWHVAERVTPDSRQIVRPSPDFAYSACAFDLTDGPVSIRVAPWPSYWSLSLYDENTDNFFVTDDREADYDLQITLIRAGRTPPEDAPRVVESPSPRGVALIRRLAPDVATHSAAAEAARGDVCRAFTTP